MMFKEIKGGKKQQLPPQFFWEENTKRHKNNFFLGGGGRQLFADFRLSQGACNLIPRKARDDCILFKCKKETKDWPIRST
jgi:hypothetical protein